MRHTNTNDVIIHGLIAQNLVHVDAASGAVFSLKFARKRRLIGAIKHGYRHWTINGHGIHTLLKFSRIVWIFCNGAIPEGLSIDHINRIKTDDRLCNLRLTTTQENNQNRDPETWTGENNGRSKLSKKLAAKIRLEKKNGATYSELRYKYKLSNGTLWPLLTGQTWK